MGTHLQSNPKSSGKSSGLAWFATVPAVAVVLAAGLWVTGVAAAGYVTSIILGIVWFVVAGLLMRQVSTRRPALRAPMLTGLVVMVIASGFGFYWTSVRDDKVNEAVATGVPVSQAAGSSTPAASSAPAGNVEVARGGFETRAHSSHGTAAVVDLAVGGRRLTFTDFGTANGPDLRVYLVKGPVRGDGDVHDTVDLGRLKGNIGNQQYEIPEGTDTTVYSTVVIWCRAFSVSFAQADLRAS